MTSIDKEVYYKEMKGLSRKQNCFDEMEVTMFDEMLDVDIFDYNSFFKICNLLPSISRSSKYLNYSYDRKYNRFNINARWEDEESVSEMVEVVTLIVETCMKAQSEFDSSFDKIWNILQ